MSERQRRVEEMLERANSGDKTAQALISEFNVVQYKLQSAQESLLMVASSIQTSVERTQATLKGERNSTLDTLAGYVSRHDELVEAINQNKDRLNGLDRLYQVVLNEQ